MTVIRWEDPPPDGRGGGPSDQWQAVADQLRANPNQWAVILEASSGTCGGWVYRIRQGKSAFRPVGDYEAVTRKDGNRNILYARYVGGEQ